MPRKRRRSEAAITRENDDTETTASDTAAGSAAATSNDTVKVDAGVQTLSKSQQTRRRRKRKRDELFESSEHPKLQNVFPKEGSKFRHGNFDTHKGFQVGGAGYGGNYDEEKVFADPRVLALEPKLFKNAKVLDIGCNAGYVPIAIGTLRKKEEGRKNKRPRTCSIISFTLLLCPIHSLGQSLQEKNMSLILSWEW